MDSLQFHLNIYLCLIQVYAKVYYRNHWNLSVLMDVHFSFEISLVIVVVVVVHLTEHDDPFTKPKSNSKSKQITLTYKENIFIIGNLLLLLFIKWICFYLSKEKNEN